MMWLRSSPDTAQRPRLDQILVLLVLGLLYCGLVQKYRAYDADNPWFLSFSYNACHRGVETDTFQEVHYPGGMDGVHLFGKVPAALQCAVMNRTGWSSQSVVGINLGFVLVSLTLWWSFLRRLGYRELWIAMFVLFLGTTEPIVSMAEKARYEFFPFFLLSLALWLAFRGYELAAALAVMPSFEAEPAGIVVILIVWLVLMIGTRNPRRLAVWFGVAGAAGAAFYLSLHPGSIHEITHSPSSGAHHIFGGTLFAYFIERRRHLPELGMILLGLALCWRWRTASAPAADRIAQWLALAAGVAVTVLPHPNVAYMIFVMPFFLWASFAGFARDKTIWLVPAVVFAGILGQYAYLYKVNLHEGFTQRDFDAVQQEIATSASVLNLPDARLQTCGDFSLWFAHPQNYSTCLTNAPGTAFRRSNLFLCFDKPLQANGLVSKEWSGCSRFTDVLRLREISSLRLKGHLLHFYVRQ